MNPHSKTLLTDMAHTPNSHPLQSSGTSTATNESQGRLSFETWLAASAFRFDKLPPQVCEKMKTAWDAALRYNVTPTQEKC